MILHGWLKRFHKDSGFCGMSASSWDKVCNVLETIEGVGCSVQKTQSGNGWLIVVDGKSGDTELPTGMSPVGGSLSGTEIWGRVVYDESDHKFQQYKMTWSEAYSRFVEAATPVDIVTCESHASQH